jgi:hypothetical protein
MRRWLISLVVASGVLPLLQAAPLGHALAQRELAFQAEYVVVAIPSDKKQIGRFKVESCLKGKLQPGQEIQVEGLASFFPADGEVAYDRLASVCLFLAPEAGTGRYRLVPTGLICLSRAGGIFRPLPWAEVGDFRLQPRGNGEQWADLLGRVQEEVIEVNRLLRARDLAIGRGRNAALLAWIERNRREIQDAASLRRLSSTDKLLAPMSPGELQDQRDRSWGELERLPFLWILDSDVLADCWRDCELYAEINGGDCLGLDHPTFCSPAGRNFLVQIALDRRHLEGSRRRALRQLGSPATLRGKGTPLDSAEQGALLEHMRPMLQARLATTRGLAALAVREISRPIAPATEFRKELVPALDLAFRSEKPGMARDALGETVRLIGGVAHWKELTGRADGFAAYLQDLETRREQLHFWLSVRTKDPIKEAATMVLERLGADGKVLEKKSIPLPAMQPAPEKWRTGWDASLPLFVELPVQGLELGSWRLFVEGTAGPDKTPWQSEPRLFVIAPVGKPGEVRPVNPQQPQPRVAILPPED